MSGRVLDFKSYLGGADNVQIKEDFPSSATTYRYDYDANISNYSFELSSQTIVIDTLAYDRNTGEPNFANANLLIKNTGQKADRPSRSAPVTTVFSIRSQLKIEYSEISCQ